MPRNSNLVMEKVTWMAAWMAILQLILMDTHQSIRSSAQRWHSSALRLSWSIWTNKIFHQNWATWTSQMIDSKYFGVILLLSYTSCFSHSILWLFCPNCVCWPPPLFWYENPTGISDQPILLVACVFNCCCILLCIFFCDCNDDSCQKALAASPGKQVNFSAEWSEGMDFLIKNSQFPPIMAPWRRI